MLNGLRVNNICSLFLPTRLSWYCLVVGETKTMFRCPGPTNEGDVTSDGKGWKSYDGPVQRKVVGEGLRHRVWKQVRETNQDKSNNFTRRKTTRGMVVLVY